MASQFSLPYQLPPIDLISPQANGAALTSGYVSLRNALKAWLVVKVNQGAATAVTITPLQATSSAGAGSKAIGGADSSAPIWLVDNTAVSGGSDVLVAQAAALAFTTDATIATKQVIFELAPEAILDLVNGFNHLAVQIAASSGSNIVAATLHILGSYQGASQPTSYV